MCAYASGVLFAHGDCSGEGTNIEHAEFLNRAVTVLPVSTVEENPVWTQCPHGVGDRARCQPTRCRTQSWKSPM